MPALSQSSHYRKFSNTRDRALEVFLHNAQKEISDYGHATFEHVLFLVGHRYRLINDHTRFTSKARNILDGLYSEIDHAMRSLTVKMVPVIQKMRTQVTLLAYASEYEAIGRGLQKHYAVKKPETHWNASEVEARIYFLLTKIKNKICGEIERGYVNSEPYAEVYARVLKKLPPVQRYKKPPRELKPLKEANTLLSQVKSATNLSFTNEDDWRQLVADYRAEYIPITRDLEFDVEVKGEEELESWYGWEIEQELTEDFLAKVKDGILQAANGSGDIDDMMWVAILDDRTREEHRLKDGLTSTEIQAKLDDEWSDFEDDAVVAPSGFKCRCRSVPYVKNMPESEGPDYAGFDEWLNS